MTTPNVTITFTLNGKTYRSSVMDLVRLSIGEARVIKRETGMKIADWRDTFRAIDREDPDLLIGLAYLMRTRAGELAEWSDLDHMSSLELMSAFDAVQDPEPVSELAGELIADATVIPVAVPEPVPV